MIIPCKNFHFTNVQIIWTKRANFYWIAKVVASFQNYFFRMTVLRKKKNIRYDSEKSLN